MLQGTYMSIDGLMTFSQRVMPHTDMTTGDAGAK